MDSISPFDSSKADENRVEWYHSTVGHRRGIDDRPPLATGGNLKIVV
jgi:hypothetical protein